MIKVNVSREKFVEAFDKAWKEVYRDDRKATLDRLYDSTTEWTDVMCGQAPRAMAGESLIRRTFGHLDVGKLKVDFDRERSKVDAFGRVIPGEHHDHTDGVNLIMVEVENSTETSYFEFWKLVQSRCLLKVLVTYELDNARVLQGALEQMYQIYQRHRDVLGPDNTESYLLVVGTRDEGNPDIRWKFFGLTGDGHFTERID